MPCSNPSGVSNSRANSVAFREKDLINAGILFRADRAGISETSARFASRLVEVDDPLDRCLNLEEAQAVLQAQSSQDPDLEEAISRCKKAPDEHSIRACYYKHERRWMMKVNEPIFQAFEEAVDAGQVAVNADYEWAGAQDLLDARAETLNNPKPDLAYGLAIHTDSRALTEGSADPRSFLNRTVIHALESSPAIRLRASPSSRDDILFPCIVYEAKSDSNPILWAENLAAVDAASCLAILRDLAYLAGDSGAIPPVVMISSAGGLWRFHLATCASNPSGTWDVVSEHCLFEKDRALLPYVETNSRSSDLLHRRSFR